MPHLQRNAPRRRQLARICTLGIVLCAALSGTTSARAQERLEPSPASYIVDADAQPIEEATVTIAQHARLWASRSVVRVAIGQEAIASVTMITSREMLVLGQKAGRTSMVVWFADGRSQLLTIDVQADLSVLQETLRHIHPSLVAQAAPDRQAVVLRGVVPTIRHARAAQDAAAAYLQAGTKQQRPGSSRMPVLGEDGDDSDGDGDFVQGEAQGPAMKNSREYAAVINLIRVIDVPQDLVSRVQSALATISPELQISRIQHGLSPSDQLDTILIEGKVSDPAGLARLIQIASRLLGDPNGQYTQIVADDSGAPALRRRGGGGGSAANSGNNGNSGNSGNSGSSGTSNSGGSNNGQAAGGNSSAGSQGRQRVESLARARGISLAKGRGLVFVEVAHLPQVRVSVRLYELNRARLRDLRTTLESNQVASNRATKAAAKEGLEPSITSLSKGITSLLSMDHGTISGGVSVMNSVLDLRHLMSFLVSKGIARSLSSPSLTVLSGEDAMFQMGGDVPVPQLAPSLNPTGNGTGVLGFATVVATFRQFGIRLQVRPLVHPDGGVTLHLRPEVSEPDAGLTASLRDATGTSQPTSAFSTRAIDTTARLRDGESLLVGGLFSRRANLQDQSYPLLSRVPLVGWLFQQWGETDDERELLILVEPTMQRDVDPKTRHWLWPRAWSPPPHKPSM